MKSIPSCLFLAALVAVSGCFLDEGARTDHLHLSHVHRGGGARERPDNTLNTFLWCWRNGAAVECDCRRTKDGMGVMFHDNHMKRTPRGIGAALWNKPLADITWDELKDVDVGSYLDPKYADERIPTIAETFAAMKGHPTWLAFVDEKGAGPDYIAAAARAAGVIDQVYYTGSSHDNIIKWNRTVPGGKSLLWIGAWPKNRSKAERERTDEYFLKQMRRLRAKDFAHITAVSLHTYYDPADPDDPFIPSTMVLRKVIGEFHAHGIKVASIPFAGGEKEETYFKLWELGCDAFSTDYPSVMFAVIAKLKAQAATGK